MAGNVPTRRQAGSGGGNSSKYISVLFSPHRHLWSTESFSNSSIQFILPPSTKFPWNNHRLIWSTGKPGKSAGERKIFICFLCHHTPTCWCAAGCARRSLPHIFWVRRVCGAAPTSAVYPCLKLLSNKIMSERAKHPVYDINMCTFNKNAAGCITPLSYLFLK